MEVDSAVVEVGIRCVWNRKDLKMLRLSKTAERTVWLAEQIQSEGPFKPVLRNVFGEPVRVDIRLLGLHEPGVRTHTQRLSSESAWLEINELNMEWDLDPKKRVPYYFFCWSTDLRNPDLPLSLRLEEDLLLETHVVWVAGSVEFDRLKTDFEKSPIDKPLIKRGHTSSGETSDHPEVDGPSQ